MTAANGEPRVRLFINYRRADAAAYARDIFAALSAHFGADSVFMDIDKIEIGSDFTEALDDALDNCHVLIAVIGREWVRATDEQGRRRIDRPDDYVRLELEAALHKDLRIVPVLVQDAAMPSPEDLPESLVPLTRRQAFELTDRRWNIDIGLLVDALDKLVARLNASTARAEPPPEPEPEVRRETSSPPVVTEAVGRDDNDPAEDTRRRRLLLAGVGAAVVILAIVAVVVALAGGSSKGGKVVSGPTTQPGAAPSTASPQSGTPASAPGGLWIPNTKEKALLARIKPGTLSNCGPEQTTPFQAKPAASIVCYGDDSAVTLTQFASPAEAQKFYAAYVDVSGLTAGQGSCTAPVPADGNGEADLVIGTVSHNDRMLCYFDASVKTDSLVWTDYANNIVFAIDSQDEAPPSRALPRSLAIYRNDITS